MASIETLHIRLDKIENRLATTEKRVDYNENRLTKAETEISSMDKYLAEQGTTLKNIQTDIHSICLTIASGKGWVIGILGAGALIYTLIDWAIKIFVK